MGIHSDANRYILSDPDNKIWSILSFLAICLSSFIFILQWRQLPFFLDMYYHLAVAKGFDVAGGLVLHNFWEYGPSGAWHIYPPLVHVIILGLLKIGFSGIIIIKILSCAVPTLFLYTIWYVIKNILNKRIAFFVVYLCLCASLFMISISFTPAATIAISLLLLAVFFIHKKHTLTAGLIMGLIFYTHTGIAMLSLLFILIAWISNIIYTKQFIRLLSSTLLVGLPWCLHTIRSIPGISWNNTAQMPVRFYPVIVALIIIGLIRVLKNMNKYKIFIILIIALMPMGILYSFRLFSSQGMIGFIVLAGIGLDSLYTTMGNTLKKTSAAKRYLSLSTLILLLYLIIFAPGINFYKDKIRLELSDSQLTAIFEGKEGRPEYIISSGIYDNNLFKKLSSYVNRYSEKGEFIWSNYRYITGILWYMTQRPSLSHMLLEINPKDRRLNLSDGSLLIIVDEPKGEFKRISKITKSNFSIMGTFKKEGADIFILKNSNLSAKQTFSITKPLICTPYLFVILCAYLVAIVLYNRYKYKKRGL